MKPTKRARSTSTAEVVHISSHGLWVHVAEQEYFLPFSEYPWFKEARVAEILNVRLLHGHHLHWTGPDVDLDLDSLKNPERYPLICKVSS